MCGQRRFSSIPGRFIVASAGSETNGGISTVRSEEGFVYAWREILLWDCGLSSIQVTFEVHGKLSRDARLPLLDQLLSRFNPLLERGTGTQHLQWIAILLEISRPVKLLCSKNCGAFRYSQEMVELHD